MKQKQSSTLHVLNDSVVDSKSASQYTKPKKNQSKHMIVLAVTTDQGNLTVSAKQTRHQ